MSTEWMKLKHQGTPPCGRTGHTMEYLPINQAIIIVGGRNDKECKAQSIPFLNDMHLFLLDQKAWIRIKYIPESDHLCRIGNHSMTVMSGGETFERLLIFGGINRDIVETTVVSPRQKSTAASARKWKSKKSEGEEKTFLGNQLFMVEIKQIM